MEPIIALNIFKDFKTQKFQITVGLNQQSAIKQAMITLILQQSIFYMIMILYVLY